VLGALGVEWAADDKKRINAGPAASISSVIRRVLAVVVVTTALVAIAIPLPFPVASPLVAAVDRVVRVVVAVDASAELVLSTMPKMLEELRKEIRVVIAEPVRFRVVVRVRFSAVVVVVVVVVVRVVVVRVRVVVGRVVVVRVVVLVRGVVVRVVVAEAEGSVVVVVVRVRASVVVTRTAVASSSLVLEEDLAACGWGPSPSPGSGRGRTIAAPSGGSWQRSGAESGPEGGGTRPLRRQIEKTCASAAAPPPTTSTFPANTPRTAAHMKIKFPKTLCLLDGDASTPMTVAGVKRSG